MELIQDLETISLAITAAETGHLVLGTLHTASASQTIDRIIDVFPTSQQMQIRVQLSSSLIGVISQTLCKTIDNKRCLAAEILVNNNAIANLIREAKSSQVYSQLQVGAKYGMQTLEQALSKNAIKGLITKEEMSPLIQHLNEFGGRFPTDWKLPDDKFEQVVFLTAWNQWVECIVSKLMHNAIVFGISQQESEDAKAKKTLKNK